MNVFCMILCTLSCPRGNSAGIPILLFSSWKRILSTAGFPQGILSVLCLPFLWGIVEQTTGKKKCFLFIFIGFPAKLLGRQSTAEFGALELFEIWLFTRPVKHFSVFLGGTSNFEGALKELRICCIFTGNTSSESAHWCLEHGDYIGVEVARNAFI